MLPVPWTVSAINVHILCFPPALSKARAKVIGLGWGSNFWTSVDDRGIVHGNTGQPFYVYVCTSNI